MARRTMDIWFNVNTGTLLDSAGNELRTSSYPYIYFKEKPLLRLRLVVNNGLTEYTYMSATDSITVIIDNDYDRTTNEICKTYNTVINQPGDWTSGGTADKTLGQLSIPLDGDTSAFDTKIGKSKELSDCFMEIIVRDSEANQTAVFDFSFRVLNIAESGQIPAPSPSGNFFTKSEELAFLEGKADKVGSSDIEITDMTKGLIFTDGVNRYRIQFSPSGVVIPTIL